MKNMNFGEVINELKAGNKVTRKAWKHKDENQKWLMYVPTSSLPYRGIGRIDTTPWIGIGVGGGDFTPWTAGQADLLANDWYVLE